MLTTYEAQQSLDEGSALVGTIFFKQQLNHEVARKQKLAAAEQSLAQANSEALLLQQQYFQEQYVRLLNICNQIKESAEAKVKALPILADPKLQESTLNSFNLVSKLTSAVDSFLKEVVAYGRSHKEDINALKNLTDDLAVTSDLLTSPTAQNMSTFQNRVYAEPKYQNDSKIAKAMIKVGEICFVASIIVMVASLIYIPLLPLAVGGGIFIGGQALTLVAAALVTFGKNEKRFAKIEDNPIISHQKAIAEEIKHQNYSRENSTLESNDEGSAIVRTFFFNQQRENKLAGLAEQTLAQSSQNALILQQQYFQYQYTRLQEACREIKKETQVRVAAIPVLNEQLWEPAIKSVNNLISVTESLLNVVAKSAREHRNDPTILKTLSTDLEVTTNLLNSPTTQNMEVFQKRTNERYGQHNLEKVGDSMFIVSLALCMALYLSIPVGLVAICFGFPLALGLLVAYSPLIMAIGTSLLSSASEKVGKMLPPPEVSYKNQIVQEVNPYIRPTPKLS